jgi:O-antigen/teichoic acid export membrane protein
MDVDVPCRRKKEGTVRVLNGSGKEEASQKDGGTVFLTPKILARKSILSLKQASVSAAKWSFVSQFGRQVMQLTTTAILARLLAPSDFGLLGMALVVTGAVDLLRDLGTSAAIIQRKELPGSSLSSLFWLNTAVGSVLTFLLWFLSPSTSLLYREPRLCLILRSLAPVFSISGLCLVHRSLLERELRFNSLAKIELVAVLTASLTGIGMAAAGFGIWSLVWQSLISAAATSAMLWTFTNWRPAWQFRWADIRPLARFSLNLTAFNLCNFFARNADYILIGRFLGVRELGYYSLAYRLMLYPLQNISEVVGRVMFPVFSRIHEDEQRFRRGYLTVASSIALVSFPMMTGLMVTSDLLVPVIFGSQWSPVIPLIIILAPIGLIQSVGTTVGSIYQVKARTDLLLRWGLFSGCVTVSAFVIGLRWGILGVASAYALVSLSLAIPSFSIPFRLIGLRVRELGSVLWRPLFATTLMLAFVLFIRVGLAQALSGPGRLVTTVMLGSLAYLTATWILNQDQIKDVWNAVGSRG